MERPKIAKELDGLHVTVEQLPPRAGMRAAVMAAKVFGPTLIELLTGQPVQIGRFRMALIDVLALPSGRDVAGLELEDEVWKAATLSIERNPELAGAYEYLARRVLASLDTMDPDDVEALTLTLLLGPPSERTGYVLVGTPPTRISHVAMLDATIPDILTLFGVLAMALEVNLRPFVRVLRTAVGS